jgi:hypothetical protein
VFSKIEEMMNKKEYELEMVRHMKQIERTSRTNSIVGQLKGCVRVPLSGAPADHTNFMPSPKPWQ